MSCDVIPYLPYLLTARIDYSVHRICTEIDEVGFEVIRSMDKILDWNQVEDELLK